MKRCWRSRTRNSFDLMLLRRGPPGIREITDPASVMALIVIRLEEAAADLDALGRRVRQQNAPINASVPWRS